MYEHSGHRRMVMEAHPVYIGKEPLDSGGWEPLPAIPSLVYLGFTRLSS